MSSMKKVFENETQTRINLIGPSKSGKSTLISKLAKQGIFDGQNRIESNLFPTEVLYSSPRHNYTKVYLDFEEKDKFIYRVKKVILNLIDEVFMEELKNNDMKINNLNFDCKLEDIAYNKIKLSLIRMFNKVSISGIFKNIDFHKLFIDLSKINRNDNLEERDKFIWKEYFSDFQSELETYYDKCMEKLLKCYAHDEEGCKYENEYNDHEYSDYEYSERFYNSNFKQLLTLIYGSKESCGLIIKRAYIKVPASKNEYSRSIFIDYSNEDINSHIASDILNRVSEDYKELFILVGSWSDGISDLFNIRDYVNKITLEKRVFCILNKFDLYRNNIQITKSDTIDTIKHKTSNLLGIKENRIIVTERFMDIDKNTLEILQSDNDFTRLLKLIKMQSQHLSKPIKIRNYSKNNVISISLNQERMSVQALMNMLYDRYNGYLVDLWNDMIKHEKDDDKRKKYYYNCVRNVIKNRKDDLKGFKCEKNGFINYNKSIDFSITHGDYNDSKKIVEMIVNYGYHTVGFNSHENKILVTVNGEISKEDKENLIKLIKGRLEESAVKYFENAFLMDISRKKFNVNSLKSCLEVEKSITIDDFYNAFKEAFKKMSENIERYEISLID